MTSRLPLGSVAISVFVLGIIGFWSIAYWSSPEEHLVESTSRKMASATKFRDLNLSKHQKKSPEKELLKPNLNVPEKKHEWFTHYREQEYKGHSYLISRFFYALPEDLYSDNAEVIKKSNGWVYFKDPEAYAQGYQLWQDTNNRAIFIATGRILIHIENEDRVHDILSLYDLEVTYKAPGRNVFLVKEKSGRRTTQITQDLKREEGVLKVELELIGSALEPR